MMRTKCFQNGRVLLALLIGVLMACFLPATARAADEVTDAPAIYLNGATGSDDNDGQSADTAVATYSRAAELAEDAGASTVYVTGTVSVSENETWDTGLALVRDPSFTNGAMVMVESGATLTLGKVTLDGNNVVVASGASSASGATSNIVRVEGTLNITDGTTLQNQNCSSSDSYSAAVLVYCGTVNMSGGSVTDNVGGKWGGAFSVVGAADALATMNLTGGEISDNTAATNGGGIYLYTYSELNMDGGTVSGNSAPNNGGGIYVGRDAVATITAGAITGNAQTSSVNYGGGGIYVESSQGQGEPGVLYLYNVEIADNSCTGSGGTSASALGYDSTIAACNTAVLQVSITDGAVIHDNNTRYDIMGYFDSDTATMEISPFMLGGGLYNWYDRAGNAYEVGGLSWSLTTVESNHWGYATTDVSTSDDTVTGLGRIKTVISGNTAVVMGAAIGTNGNVYIGKSDGDVTLNISKVWDDSVVDPADSVTIAIYATDGSGQTTQIGSVELSEDNNWSATVENLPKWDSDGLEYTYSVSEESDDYLVDIDDQVTAIDDSTDEYEFVVTNSKKPDPVVSDGFVAQKVLEGGDLEAGQFTFELRDENGDVVQTATNDADGMVYFDGITFSEEGVYTFTIAEVDDGQEGVTYDTSVKTCTVTVELSDDGEFVATNAADENLVFTNIYEAPVTPGDGDGGTTDDTTEPGDDVTTDTEADDDATSGDNLLQTGDPVSIASVAVAAAAGIGAIGAGAFIGKRRK